MVDLESLMNAVIYGKKPLAEQLTQQALDDGAAPEVILHQGLVPGMQVVGDKFKANEFYVPEMLVAARAMKAAMALLRPSLIERKIEPIGRVAIGTVRGDLHDIGKNLVAMMLEGAGFEILDLGVDVDPARFAAGAQEAGVNLLCMSALLTTTMSAMRDTIINLEKDGLRQKVKVLVGGAPVTSAWAAEIGADGYAADAASAVDTARTLLGR
ncbi:MAG TPA: cobalamin-dependent protein [Armatimonadota bacterium]|nr:cobalamin-dependent protein [Armatimonadota bacterium]